jgi:hypothetical protein
MKNVLLLLATANIVPSSLIPVTLMMEAIRSSETLAHTRDTGRNISEYWWSSQALRCRQPVKHSCCKGDIFTRADTTFMSSFSFHLTQIPDKQSSAIHEAQCLHRSPWTIATETLQLYSNIVSVASIIRMSTEERRWRANSACFVYCGQIMDNMKTLSRASNALNVGRAGEENQNYDLQFRKKKCLRTAHTY